MRQAFLRARFVEFIPERLADGVLYVSERYRTATHRCCCGCGEEVVTPLGPTDWSLRVANGAVTLYPSIGNWSLACRSHYWVRNGEVGWAASMTRQQIEQGRARDRHLRDAYFEEVNRRKEAESAIPPPNHATPALQRASGWFDGAWRAFRKRLAFSK